MSDEELIQRFGEAFNARDLDALLAFLAPDAEVVLARGRFSGSEGLRRMVDLQSYGVGFYVFPQRIYGRDGNYAVGARAELRYVETGELAEAIDDRGALFEIRDGQIARFVARPSQAVALAEAGLEEADLVAELQPPPGR